MRAQVLGERLRRMLLPSASQLRAGTELSDDQAKRGLRDLTEAQLVASAEMGCLQPAVPRTWFTQSGLAYFRPSAEERSWHGPHGLGNLIIYDLPRIEAVNALAPFYETPDWRLFQVHFYEREPLFAAAEFRFYDDQPLFMASPYRGPGEHRGPDEYAPAYVAFCWASVMDTQRELVERLRAAPEAMQKQATRQDRTFLPAALAIVGHEEWPVARALSMAREVLSRWVDPSHIRGCYYGGDGWRMSDASSVLTGRPPDSVPPLLPPLHTLRMATSVRKLGKQKFDNVVKRHPWGGRTGRSLFELLTKVGEFPVGGMSHYQAFVGESREGTETKERMARLISMGLAEVVKVHARVKVDRLPQGVPATISERGQGAHRYALTKAGRVAYCRAHGGSPSVLASRTKMGLLRVEKGRWSYRHEDCLYETLAQLCEMGCSIAPGWQARVTLADGRRIHPDGIVLVETPWGRLWCFLEVELSDRSYSAVQPRVERYASEHRRDAHPVLIVCHDDRAEYTFHLAGLECNPLPRMLTTTLRRLRDGGVAGAVWSFYGRPCTLAV